MTLFWRAWLCAADERRSKTMPRSRAVLKLAWDQDKDVLRAKRSYVTVVEINTSKSENGRFVAKVKLIGQML